MRSRPFSGHIGGRDYGFANAVLVSTLDTGERQKVPPAPDF